MNKNNNTTNSINNNSSMDQLFVNCACDMDYLEVVKIEPIKRYEENVFLMSKIFSNYKDSDNVDSKNLNKASNISNKMEIEEESNLQNQKEDGNTNINNDYQKDKEIYTRISNLVHNNENNNINNRNEENFKGLNKTEILDIIAELQKSNLTSGEETLINQVVNSIEEYEDIEALIKRNKESFANKRDMFNNITNKTKQIKQVNEFGDLFKDILNVADYKEILNDTIIDFNRKLDEYKKLKCGNSVNSNNNESTCSNDINPFYIDCRDKSDHEIKKIKPFTLEEKLTYNCL